jgi:hypothetical protein
LAARAASSTPTPTVVVDASGPPTKRMTFKPMNPPRRKDLPQASSNSPSSYIPPRLSAEAAGPKSASSSRQPATPDSTAKSQNPTPKSRLPGASVADSSVRHPVVLKRISKPQVSASTAPFGAFFQPLEPVAGSSNSTSTTREFKIKEEDIVQHVVWEHPPSTQEDSTTSSGLAGTTSTGTLVPTAASDTSPSGRCLEVPKTIPQQSTAPSPASLPRSWANVHQLSPRPLLTPARDSSAKPTLAPVDPEGQVRASVVTEKAQEKTKAPEIEGEPTEDVDLGDVDCVARELLCPSSPDHLQDEDLEGRGRVGSSSGGEEEEDEGDELVALSTEYLQKCVFW